MCAGVTMAEKAAIETRLEEFVKSKTAESVCLDISSPSVIFIKRRAKYGSILLGTFWMNVLQHPRNYPIQHYPYRRLYDKNGHYKVVLRVDDVTVTVFMTSGTLMIQGSFVLDWFLKRFSKVMDAYEMPSLELVSMPPLEPQPVSDGYTEHQRKWKQMMAREKEMKDLHVQKQKEKEEKALLIAGSHDDYPLCKPGNGRSEDREERVLIIEGYHQDFSFCKPGVRESNTTENQTSEDNEEILVVEGYHTDCSLFNHGVKERNVTKTRLIYEDLTVQGLTEDFELMSLKLWTGIILENQLSLLRTPIIKDGPTYIYKLWRSLLYKWMTSEDCRVYIATPFLDTERMTDVIRIALHAYPKSNLEAFYVRMNCNYGVNMGDVRKEAMNQFEIKLHPDIECNVYRKIVYPLNRFHVKFIACVNGDGQAEVLVTSANFTAEHFRYSNAESVVYHTISEAQFHQRFIAPLSSSQD